MLYSPINKVHFTYLVPVLLLLAVLLRVHSMPNSHFLPSSAGLNFATFALQFYPLGGVSRTTPPLYCISILKFQSPTTSWSIKPPC